jgi:hypothetical protein
MVDIAALPWQANLQPCYAPVWQGEGLEDEGEGTDGPSGGAFMREGSRGWEDEFLGSAAGV